MNIWIMNHYASQMLKDKAGRHYWFAKKLKEKENDVTVFCASTYLKNNEKIDTNGKRYVKVLVEDIPFVVVDVLNYSGNGLDRVKNMISFFLNLFPVTKKYAKESDVPDVIIASSVHPLTMVAGILIARKFKCPCICEVRDLWPEAIFAFGRAKEKSLLGKVLVIGEHWIYKKADALIFTKEGDMDYLKEHRWTTVQGGDIDLNKCYYINNGVDLAAYEEKIKTKCLDDGDLSDESKFNVIYAGIIRPINNVGNLLDCAAILKKVKGYENVNFLIYGDGSELEVLRKRVNEEKLNNVKLKGFVERKFIPYILSKASINVLNYSQKKYNWSRGNSSNKLFEYMASGKPIISTVHMGYSIINKYNCGVELDEDSPKALTEEIMRFYDMDKAERDEIGKNARSAVEDFDFNVLTDKLIKVIEGVI